MSREDIETELRNAELKAYSTRLSVEDSNPLKDHYEERLYELIYGMATTPHLVLMRGHIQANLDQIAKETRVYMAEHDISQGLFDPKLTKEEKQNFDRLYDLLETT